MSTLRLTYGPEATPISPRSALSACESGALKDKVVVVTGGTKGFGRAFAVRAAVEFGARVVVAARGAKGVEETVEEIRRKGGCVVFLLPLSFYLVWIALLFSVDKPPVSPPT